MTAALAAVIAVSVPPPAAPAVFLAVRAAAVPVPALKYRLLPPVRDLKPGNPVQWYVRCFAEQRNFFYGPDSADKRVRLRAAPLAEVAKENLQSYGGSALTQADYAARLDAPDWDVLRRVQDDGLALRLPELDALRLLAESLHLRLRGEATRDDFPAALTTAQTLLALARHLADCPASDATRLALAVADMALSGLEELVARPGCPNLYWALADLPAPLVGVRRGVEGDRARAAAELRGLKETALSPADLDGLVGRLSGRLGLARARDGLPPRGLRPRLAELARDDRRVKAARDRLVAERGWKLALVTLPPAQLILLDEWRAFEARCDEADKLVNLTLPDAERLAAAPNPAGDAGLFAELLPRPLGLRREQARVDQRAALLRHVEALRAGDASLPLPADPATGRPFAVGRGGAATTLRAAATRPGGRGASVVVTVSGPDNRGER